MRKKDEVLAAVIGAGHFGTAVVTQQKYGKYLRLPIVADKDLELAKSAFIKADIPEDKIEYADSASYGYGGKTRAIYFMGLTT